MFILMGIFLAKLLQTKDRELLHSRFQAYEEILQLEGVSGLHNSNAAKRIADSWQFYVRYADADGKTRFIHVPGDHHEDSSGQSIEELEKFLAQHKDSSWIVFPGEHYGDDIELVSGPIAQGGILQVGKDTEDREAFLKEYLNSFLIIFIPAILFAVGIGLTLSVKLLAPIRWLKSTITGIQQGHVSSRVPLRGGNDELNELGNLFNQMLDKNQLLVRTMTEALDNVSHDLRTPIMRLRNSVERSFKHGAGIEDLREALSDAMENSGVILKILDATLDISEAEAGTLRLERQRIDVEEFLHYVVDLYQYYATEKGFKIQTEFLEDCVILADRTRLTQAVSNLLDNAIKYSDESSSITIGLRLDKGMAVIFVADRGAGIKTEDEGRIWNRFYRSDASRSTRGLGLGLSLVRAIAVAHGGSVNYTPNTGGGSVFSIAIPREE